METPLQMCARLVTALEALAAEEAVCLQMRDFVAVVAVQERAQPLVDHLVAHGPEVADEALRDRIAKLLERRHESGGWLAAEVARTREQLRSLEVSQRQAGKIAPVYGGRNPMRNRLCAVG